MIFMDLGYTDDVYTVYYTVSTSGDLNVLL